MGASPSAFTAVDVVDLVLWVVLLLLLLLLSDVFPDAVFVDAALPVFSSSAEAEIGVIRIGNLKGRRNTSSERPGSIWRNKSAGKCIVNCCLACESFGAGVDIWPLRKDANTASLMTCAIIRANGLFTDSADSSGVLVVVVVAIFDIFVGAAAVGLFLANAATASSASITEDMSVASPASSFSLSPCCCCCCCCVASLSCSSRIRALLVRLSLRLWLSFDVLEIGLFRSTFNLALGRNILPRLVVFSLVSLLLLSSLDSFMVISLLLLPVGSDD